MSNRILMIYEEIPDRTVILDLRDEDLKAAGLSRSDVADLHGRYVNLSDLTDAQQAISDRVSAAIFGEWKDDKKLEGPALWADRIIFRTDEPELGKEGFPPMACGDFVVIHTGFVL